MFSVAGFFFVFPWSSLVSRLVKLDTSLYISVSDLYLRVHGSHDVPVLLWWAFF
ncbi:hypothetical protein CANTEDRAFT_116696 [Yamadazyma tenuis ATCC 10573]|uniref:Uncharacterized protein n=1 Tax=Candida tenuis (strain ATCC 10573 / BCRC 21748 / CBS 615 / JCM 9827 / NBRC 10315 / NRRL Y-1498 / VKM Y-70) TaxID=590646 RepID=G3BF39_CANTC|nr:uncharacterized protein CANTEDRAFT_116696 [Yamadazyma tenuis ATCC 10573]EGV60627.1 hypothetical protein CANTEDRAFT_116696 [Yamadazyma tenuis ATCC 10573]